MRILMLTPDQSLKYNWGHHLFRQEVARQADVVFYGLRYPLYEKSGNDYVPEIVEEFGPFDVIFVEGPRYAGFFMGMEDVKGVIKTAILVDYNQTRRLHQYHRFIEKMDLSRVFFPIRASQRKFLGQVRRKAVRNIQGDYLPFSVDTNIYRRLGVEKTFDVMAVFSVIQWAYPYRKKIQELVTEMPVKALVSGGIPGSRIVHEKYVECINRSKIFISESSIAKIVTMKYYECLACGTFLLTDRPEGMEALGFVDGEHLVLYDGLDDLRGKIEYYLEHEQEREEIAERGMDLVRNRHSGKIRAKQFLRYLSDENFVANC